MSLYELFIRLGVALLLGIAIGVERQWRSHYVGLRTNTLVTLSSAAMTVFSLKFAMGDPSATSRIVAGIIAGVGFLGAGVIIHEGMTVRGCHTAATLWCSVAVGLFAGGGYLTEAAMLTGFIILINLFLRPISHYINEQTECGKACQDDKEGV